MKKLKQDLCMVNSYGWTILSDKQKVSFALFFSPTNTLYLDFIRILNRIHYHILFFLFYYVGIEGINRRSITKFRSQVLCATHA